MAEKQKKPAYYPPEHPDHYGDEGGIANSRYYDRYVKEVPSPYDKGKTDLTDVDE